MVKYLTINDTFRIDFFRRKIQINFKAFELCLKVYSILEGAYVVTLLRNSFIISLKYLIIDYSFSDTQHILKMSRQTAIK